MIYIHNQTLRIRYRKFDLDFYVILYNVSGESGYECKSLIICYRCINTVRTNQTACHGARTRT